MRLGGVAIPAPSQNLWRLNSALTSIRLVGAAAALWILLPGDADRLFHLRRHLLRRDGSRSGHAHTRRSRHFRSRRVLGLSRSRLLRRRGSRTDRLPLHLLPAAAGALGRRLRLFRGRRRGRRRKAAADERLARAAARLSPMFLSVMAFTTGAMLLVSGATPTFSARLAELSVHVPLWAVESSHFLGSLIGVVFLFVAHGLLDRRDGAWKLALALTAVGSRLLPRQGTCVWGSRFPVALCPPVAGDVPAVLSPDIDDRPTLHLGLVRRGRRHRRRSFRHSVSCFSRYPRGAGRPLVAVRIRRPGPLAPCARFLAPRCSPSVSACVSSCERGSARPTRGRRTRKRAIDHRPTGAWRRDARADG